MDETNIGPAGDVLEEIVRRGPARLPHFVACYPAADLPCRAAILLGGLLLGPEAVEACRGVLRSPDSKAKLAFALGFGQLGHPEAEGYLARLLRETENPDLLASAVRCLGRTRGARAMPLLVQALDREVVFEPACEALTEHGGPEAVAALRPRADRFPAFQALAALGPPEAKALFVEHLGREPPWGAQAARGLAGVGDPSLAGLLLPLLRSDDAATRRAAFEGYARLGAPEGAQPLLETAARELRPWMIPALGAAASPEACRFLLDALAPAAPRGFWRNLFRRSKGGPAADPRAVYRALRGAVDPDTVARLAARLPVEKDFGALRELLSSPPLAAHPQGRGPLEALWRGEDLRTSYLAARAFLRAPTAGFLSEALQTLGKPGFRALDQAAGLADPGHLMKGYATDNNVFLLVGELLDSEFVDLAAFETFLRGRFRGWGFPEPVPPSRRFQAPQDGDVAQFLEALDASQPAGREPLDRLWGLLADAEGETGAVLDLFLCSTGVHRGGVHRALARGLPGAVDRFLVGKSDRELPELEAVAARVPPDAPVSPELRQVFSRARRRLMAECRDLVLVSEGAPRGDVVLMEIL